VNTLDEEVVGVPHTKGRASLSRLRHGVAEVPPVPDQKPLEITTTMVEVVLCRIAVSLRAALPVFLSNDQVTPWVPPKIIHEVLHRI